MKTILLLIFALPAAALEQNTTPVAGVNGQAITPASVAATGIVSGSTVNATGTGYTVNAENGGVSAKYGYLGSTATLRTSISVASYTFTAGAIGAENYLTMTNPNNSTGFVIRPRRSDGNQMIALMINSDGNIAYNPPSLTDAIPNGITVSSRPYIMSGAGAFFIPLQRTLAQAHALAPKLGSVITCSDCTRPYTILVGTGTAVDDWREQGLTTGAQ